MKVALDTTNILGRGAVKDTCNLLADGIVKLMRALAAVEQSRVKEWGKARGYEGYLGSSVKGEAAIDWSDKRARAALLAGIVGDADRLLELARQAQGELGEDRAERQQIVVASELLGQLLLQDVERAGGGVSLKDGVSRDRMMSVHDPEMRHGHKSSSRRFDGHKAAIVVDTDSQLITAVEVLPGNAPDNLGALELVEQSEANTGVPVEEEPWATPPTATAIPGRPSPMRDAGWWPECREDPTGSTFPRMTLSSTWLRAVAPVRRDRLPTPSCRRESGRIARGGSTACRPSSSTGPNVGPVHCGPSASQPREAGGGGC